MQLPPGAVTAEELERQWRGEESPAAARTQRAEELQRKHLDALQAKKDSPFGAGPQPFSRQRAQQRREQEESPGAGARGRGGRGGPRDLTREGELDVRVIEEDAERDTPPGSLQQLLLQTGPGTGPAHSAGPANGTGPDQNQEGSAPRRVPLYLRGLAYPPPLSP